MENAADALIMAGSVLLLIIALSVSISSFTNLRVQVDEIVKAEQTMDLTKDEAGNYINYISTSSDVRTVTAETIISSIRRVPKENFVVCISFKGGTEDQLMNAGYNQDDRNFLLTEQPVTQTYKEKDETETKIIDNERVIRIALSSKNGQDINKVLTEKFYNLIKDKNFNEYLGIYQYAAAEGVSSANKETYRVITFVES